MTTFSGVSKRLSKFFYAFLNKELDLKNMTEIFFAFGENKSIRKGLNAGLLTYFRVLRQVLPCTFIFVIMVDKDLFLGLLGTLLNRPQFSFNFFSPKVGNELKKIYLYCIRKKKRKKENRKKAKRENFRIYDVAPESWFGHSV